MLNPHLIDHPIPTFLRSLSHHQPDFSLLHRVSHRDSAGSTTEHGITCGSWSRPKTRDHDFLHQWLNDTPEQHFDNHFNKSSRTPTMFISTTPDFLRALHMAARCYQERKQEIKITIIGVAAARRTHHDLTNAGVIARGLDRLDSTKNGTEWLFLGRVTKDAILHQISFDDRLYQSLCEHLPSFKTSTNLEMLRYGVREDFRRYDQWMFDGSDPAADDGLRCALVANNFGLDLPNQNQVYAWLVEEMWSWEGFIKPTEEQVCRFEETVNCWGMNREDP